MPASKAAEAPVAQSGIKRKRFRLGMVVTESVTIDPAVASIDNIKVALNGGTPEDRFNRLREQVTALAIEQFMHELAYIERKLIAQRFNLTGRDDPVEHAMVALERAMQIADTEHYFQALRKYQLTAKSRAKKLYENRNDASHFPTGSPAERELVKRFTALADSGKARRNIPAKLHRYHYPASVSLMSIRRALQRLNLIAKPKPRKQK